MNNYDPTDDREVYEPRPASLGDEVHFVQGDPPTTAVYSGGDAPAAYRILPGRPDLPRRGDSDIPE